MNCRYCGQLINGDGVKTFSYWSKAEFVCHPQCKESGEKQEAIDCQIIDSDCNDCRHFKRTNPEEKRWLSCMHNRKPSIRLVGMGYFDGHCLKFDLPTVAQPNKWTGMECFEHRKINEK